MANTIRHRILDLLLERLRGALVKDATISPPDGSSAADVGALTGCAQVSGTYADTFPRMFNITVSALNRITITDATLWADLGPSHPVIAPVTQAYVSGVPFTLANTGISVTITHNATATAAWLVGKSWVVRMAKASETVSSIEAYRTAWNDEPFPRLSVFASSDDPDTQGTLESSTKRLQINLLLDVDSQNRNGGRIEEILGDIENEMLRDVYMYDNTQCLAQNIEFLGSTLYDADESSISMVMTFEIRYRNKLTNTRVQ